MVTFPGKAGRKNRGGAEGERPNIEARRRVGWPEETAKVGGRPRGQVRVLT